ncbi:MAG: hypothetical protein AAF587_29370 [Bacteroidota bacterium]
MCQEHVILLDSTVLCCEGFLMQTLVDGTFFRVIEFPAEMDTSLLWNKPIRTTYLASGGLACPGIEAGALCGFLDYHMPVNITAFCVE